MILISAAALTAAQIVPPLLQQASLPALATPDALGKLSGALIVDEPGDGRIWVRAATWKAAFGREGFEFIPFFGSDAPQNYPITFDLTDVSVGGEAIALRRRSLELLDRTVTLDRGAMREVYHLDEAHVEQTFVFDSLPGSGDLVLDLDIQTELGREENQRGFLFENDFGSVSYGSATAIDAAGKHLVLEQSLTENGIRIVVPDTFVRTVELPLVVDPVIRTFSVTNDARRQIDVDVAYSGQNAIHQIVFSEINSAADSDVINVFYNLQLDLLGPAVAVDITSEDWTQPRNAYTFRDQQFMCVAVVGDVIGNRRVWGRTREAGSGVSGSPLAISDFGAEYVDIGGKGNDGESFFDYMVVWQQADAPNQDFDIVARTVSSDGLLLNSPIVVSGDPLRFDRFPSISKASGRPDTPNAENEYMIAWERELTPTDANIHCRVIEYTGSLAGHEPFRAYSFSESRRPDVSSWSELHDDRPEDRYWVLAFERRTGSNFDIFSLVAYDGSADNAKNVQVMQDYDEGLNHRSPKIAHDGQDFNVAYYSEDPTGVYPIFQTTMSVIADDGELRVGLGERRQRIGVSNEPPALGFTSHWDGGVSLGTLEVGQAFLLWLRRPSLLASDLEASLVDDGQRNVVGAQYCSANVNSTGASAWIRAEGSLTGSGILGLGLRCTQMPPSSFGYFLCSLDAGFTPNPAGSAGNLCLQGGIGRFRRSGEILNSGSAGEFVLTQIDLDAFPTPSGNVSVATGETWYFTTWFRDIGPTSNFSNGVEVYFY